MAVIVNLGSICPGPYYRILSVFIRNGFDGTVIMPFQNKFLFLRVCTTGLLKPLWEKEKLLVTSNFSFSHSVFYSFGELSAIFIEFEIVVYELFQFVKSLNFFVWESYLIISPFPTVFSTRLENFLPFSSNLKLSYTNSFSL